MSYHGLPFQVGHDLAQTITIVRRYRPGQFCYETNDLVKEPRPGFVGCLAVEQTRAVVRNSPSFASREKILSTKASWEF